MARNIVWDGNSAVLTVIFFDAEDNPDAPTTVSYRIDCLTNNQEVRGDTDITPAETVKIPLTSSENTLINETNKWEKRVVTVTAGYGTGDDVIRKYPYLVKTLKCSADWVPKDVYVGFSDDIGFGHEDDYMEVTEID